MTSFTRTGSPAGGLVGEARRLRTGGLQRAQQLLLALPVGVVGELVPVEERELRHAGLVDGDGFRGLLAGLAFRLINAYLEVRGDYAGVRVLRYYLVYRALVRSMVALLRRKQLAGQGAAAATVAGDAEAHLLLAQQLASPPAPVLFVMHGLSGSGKTRASGHLMERWPAIRVRSDVERKRLLGLAADQATKSAIGSGAYSRDATEATYQRLLEVSAAALEAGFSMIVDAANLQRAQRERFCAFAAEHRVRFVIVSCVAPEEELRRRLRERVALGTDASEADESVLDEQLRRAEPLDATELSETVIAGPGADDAEGLIASISTHLRRT